MDRARATRKRSIAPGAWRRARDDVIDPTIARLGGVPAPPNGEAHTGLKGIGRNWIDAGNEQGNGATITLTVPSDPKYKNTRYDYWVKIKHFKKLDPRIVIQ